MEHVNPETTDDHSDQLRQEDQSSPQTDRRPPSLASDTGDKQGPKHQGFKING